MSGVVDFGPLIATTPAAVPALGATLVAGDHPLVLLPVRLETRYAATADGGRELLVRIFPDQVHVDAHDPRLSVAEAEAGQQFWLADWRSGDDQQRRRRAWQTLAERFDPGRAAWIATVTRPANSDDRPASAAADGEPPAVQPVFAPVDTSERRATPVARLMPAAWVATAYAGGQVAAAVTGRPVPFDPAVGPDLGAPLAQPATDDDDDHEVAAVDTGMHWLIDFAAAEEIGMALRLPVSGPVDVLLVTGVRDGGPEAGATDVAALLDAQRYTAGLGFVERGTLTNNTVGAPAGWSSSDIGALDLAGAVGDGSAAAVAARALGVADVHLSGVGGADGDGADELTAAVARVLWPATWGYWLTQFVGVGSGGLTLDGCDWARDHSTRFVRPGGPLPSLRIGRQPYGLLPVTSSTRFQGDSRQTRLGSIVAGLIAAGWRPAAGNAARVGRGDPVADLVDVLRLEAWSSDVALRRSLGSTFAANALDFLQQAAPGEAWVALAERTQAITAAAGLGARIPAAMVVHQPVAWPVDLPLVGDAHGAVLSDLVTGDVDTLAATVASPPSVLAALVRHGWLREHADAAARLIGDVTVAPHHDEEIYGFGGTALSWSAQRDRPLGDATVRTRLASATDPASSGLEAFRDAVATVAAAPADAVVTRLAGLLDAASHRIDVWATSLATRRLAELRDDRPSGVIVGGYGWVEALQPDAGEAVSEPVEGETGSLRLVADDPGFLHAPSIHQAEVAALLRNTHLSHGGGDDGPFAITITSQRVRLAQRIFDGVRAGGSLGAVLGYLVERDLHERGLDAAVDNAREVAPLPGQETLPVAARRLDGLALHALWAGSEDHAVDHLVNGSQDTGLRRRAAGVLRRLGVAVDAAADLLQAEQVHHFARGNLTAAVNTLGDIDRGLAPPPDLDFIRTPRGGATVTHRVAILMDIDADPRGGWARAASPWAAGEPALDAWLAGRLPPVAGVDLVLADAAASDDAAIHTVALADLGLAAVDFVRMASAGEAGVAELTARAVRALPAALARPQLRPDRDLLDLFELGRSLAGLVAAARPLDGAALQPPHADPEGGVDIEELTARAGAAAAAARAAAAALDAAMVATSGAAVGDALAATWGFAVGDAGVPIGADEAALRAAAGDARQALLARLDEADGITVAVGEELLSLQRRLRAILGPGFVSLPRIVSAVDDLVASRDDPALVGDDPLVAETWLTRMERVRDPLMRLGVALREAEAMSGAAMSLHVAQTPHTQGDAWNGRAAPSYVDGAASFVLVGGEVLAPGRPLAGLLVDEFTEVVPSPSETTGIAFHYEPPTAMAPQAVLVAVPPVLGEDWTVGGLNTVLLETLDLAHLRSIAPHDLTLVRQFLPATVLAFNTDGEVPSTNPNSLTGG